MLFLISRPFRKDNIYFRTIEEREKIIYFLVGLAFCNDQNQHIDTVGELDHKVISTDSHCIPDSNHFWYEQSDTEYTVDKLSSRLFAGK